MRRNRLAIQAPMPTTAAAIQLAALLEKQEQRGEEASLGRHGGRPARHQRDQAVFSDLIAGGELRVALAVDVAKTAHQPLVLGKRRVQQLGAGHQNNPHDAFAAENAGVVVDAHAAFALQPAGPFELLVRVVESGLDRPSVEVQIWNAAVTPDLVALDQSLAKAFSQRIGVELRPFHRL